MDHRRSHHHRRAPRPVDAGRGVTRCGPAAERRRALVADPLPHRDGAAPARGLNHRLVGQTLGVDADGAHEKGSAGLLVPRDEIGQRRAPVAGHTGRHTGEGEPDRLLGEEHQGGAPRLCRADGDEEGYRHLLGVRPTASSRVVQAAPPRRCRCAMIFRPPRPRRRGCWRQGRERPSASPAQGTRTPAPKITGDAGWDTGGTATSSAPTVTTRPETHGCSASTMTGTAAVSRHRPSAATEPPGTCASTTATTG